MTINEAKQSAYSAANRAKGKCEELLKNPAPTMDDAIELLQMSKLLSHAAGSLLTALPTPGQPGPIARVSRAPRRKA